MKNQIIRFFPTADLRAGHLGLTQIAKENGIDTQKLSQGEFVMFCNRRKTGLKIYAQNNIICYLKPKEGQITLDAIRYLPKTFNGSAFNYDEAVRKSLEEKGFKK